uniref:Myb-like domain-containing protein n=1 Tax=Globisporangium ultimum (strain ATCC 200006 / CBS 805.95 / DAOM BR144) TaxID=431595 RepID=K3XBE5_GLOUD
GYAFPRNSPEFACENVGDRVKGKRRKYCPHEVTALVLGVQRYADDSCPWSSILRDPHLGHLFHGRSGVDLKDKWRTLIKTRPELASYTENRKNHRKYRPFSAAEERALMEGVKKYNGQRNVWSLILIDKDLGPQFNDRSNVQLKDKFRTMRRSGTTSSVVVSNPSSRRSSNTPTSASGGTPSGGRQSTSSSGRPLTPTSAALSAAVSAAINGGSRSGSVSAVSQQAANLLCCIGNLC